MLDWRICSQTDLSNLNDRICFSNKFIDFLSMLSVCHLNVYFVCIDSSNKHKNARCEVSQSDRYFLSKFYKCKNISRISVQIQYPESSI